VISIIATHVKAIVKKIFDFMGLALTTKKNLVQLKSLESSRSDATLKLLRCFPSNISADLLRCIATSNSQLQQDLFVLGTLQCKRNGFFVEFGATDGIALSNTYLLESDFGWSGILAEPARNWQKNLSRNRPLSNISELCVWKTSGEKIKFLETKQMELSTLETFKSKDAHRNERSKGSVYEVETISLVDLLRKYNAPKIVDFLSIDTEGSEFEILESFDFNAYKFMIIVCEHNFTENRSKIYDLLTSRGYVRVLEDISFFDDWYVFGDLAGRIQE
jgi:FkbM family methyltransferase